MNLANMLARHCSWQFMTFKFTSHQKEVSHEPAAEPHFIGRALAFGISHGAEPNFDR